MRTRPSFCLFCLCVALGISHKAVAQDETKPGRNFFNKDEYDNRIFFGGLVAGMNFSTVDGDTYGGYSKLGFNGGGIVYIKLMKRLLGSVQILYTQRGSRGVNVYDNYYTGTSIEKYYLDLNYVEVPVILHFLLDSKWQVGFGASYSQLLTSHESAYTATPVYLNETLQPFHKQDFEYIASGTMQIYRGWFLDFTYQYSINSIRDPENVPVGFGYGNEQRNGMFTLRLVRLIN